MSDTPSPISPPERDNSTTAPAPSLPALLLDQRRRWPAGERLLVEHYVERHPVLWEDAAAMLDLIYNEVVQRERHGEEPALEEYLRRFPHLADPLRLQFAMDRALGGKVLAPSGPSHDAVAAVLVAPGSLASPEMPSVADYEMLGVLGKGGMGVAYKAWHVPLKRVVALKMIRAGDEAGPDELARFRTEAEAIGRLQHPNIVQVFEVGLHGRRPYLALEYLEGGSLDALLNGTPWPARQAAGLVQTLACAVQHAHERGVLHRDLKPANVLLAADSTPKITDFGLAKIVAGGGAGHTQTGAVQGTPSYMAPEQAEGRTKEVGPLSDVYALGAILYELLTGRPPFRAATLLETLLQVRTEEPVPPSRLQPRTPRDLETIALKCLHKDPARRYASALALADDLSRFLAGEPIRARPVGRAERLLKWVRRRPASAALGGVLLAVVLAGGGIGLAQAHARAVTVGAAREALSQAASLRADARAGPGEDLTAWSAALAAAQRAEALLEQSGGNDELRQQAGALRAELESEGQDRRMLNRLEEIRLRQSEQRPGRLERLTSDKGQGGTSWYSGFDHATADRDYAATFRQYGIEVDALTPEAAAALLRERPIWLKLAAALDDWAFARRESRPEDTADWQRLVEAARLADPDPWRDRVRDALAQRNKEALRTLAAEGRLADLPAPTAYLLGTTLGLQDDIPGAVQVLRQAQQLHPGDFWINFNLAHYLTRLDPPRAEEAVRFYTAALALRSQSPAVYNNLGAALYQKGDLDGAIAAYRTAVRLRGDYFLAYSNLGGALQEKGELDLAIEACREAIRLRPDLAQPHYHLAMALEKKGLVDQAIQALREAARCDETCVDAHQRLGHLLLDRKKDPAAAIPFLEKAASLRPEVAHNHFNLGHAYFDKREWDNAIASYRKAVACNAKHAEAHFSLGLAFEKKSDNPEALRAFRAALAVKADYAEAHSEVGQALARMGRYAEGLAALKRGHELGSRDPGFRSRSARWVRQCERLVELDAKLPGILRGETQPRDAAERLELALICAQKDLYAGAARLYQEAFADPSTAEALKIDRRYPAACVAALAGCGQGADAAQLDEAQRRRWRRQVLEWLRADLILEAKQLDGDDPRRQAQVRQALREWQQEPALAGVRDAPALAKLPEEEREGWRRLWADIEAMLGPAP